MRSSEGLDRSTHAAGLAALLPGTGIVDTTKTVHQTGEARIDLLRVLKPSSLQARVEARRGQALGGGREA
jgi:hypothetical protein